jgi:AcrR family transcriptional regulator
MILSIKNAILTTVIGGSDVAGADVASRIAGQTMARRGADYTVEVRRLLDAALEVMASNGTRARARVADIVTTAGLSNETFYRHFKSKDALVGALLEDGAERLRRYLAHQMDKERTAAGQVRRWVQGVLSQADEENARPTLAVLWNAASLDRGIASGRHFASAPLATLLYEPFTELGSTCPELAAALAAHAVLGTLSDHLWQGSRPTAREVRTIVDFCLAAVGGERTG